MKCRVLSAIHTLTDNEALTKALKSVRSRTVKWGLESGDGFVGVAKYFRKNNVVMIECRRLITEQEPSYQTDTEYEQAPLNVQDVRKNVTAEQGGVKKSAVRGPGKKKLAQEEAIRASFELLCPDEQPKDGTAKNDVAQLPCLSAEGQSTRRTKNASSRSLSSNPPLPSANARATPSSHSSSSQNLKKRSNQAPSAAQEYCSKASDGKQESNPNRRKANKASSHDDDPAIKRRKKNPSVEVGTEPMQVRPKRSAEKTPISANPTKKASSMKRK